MNIGQDRKYVRSLIDAGYLMPYVLPLAKRRVVKREDLGDLAIPEWAAPQRRKGTRR